MKMLLNRLSGLARTVLTRGGQQVRCLVGAPQDMGGSHYDKIRIYNFPEFAVEPLPQQKTIEEIKAELEARKPTVELVDLGLPHSAGLKRKERTYTVSRNARSKTLEKESRLRQLKVSFPEVKEEWKNELGPSHEKTIAEHYGIYSDLFYNGYFYPVVPMTVAFDYKEDDELVTPVHTGNYIPAAEASTCPHIEFEPSEGGHFYTLVMTNLDGHLQDNEAEYLHWAVGNMTGDGVTSGELLCEYLQPFPARGSGFHRHVFVLYQHQQQLDFSPFKRPQPCCSLEERTFHSKEFLEKYDGALVPVGLRFFQTDWDRSVSDVYHKVLDMREPEFEYMHPPPYHPPQVHYPGKQPFDRYYDRYRDKKDLGEEVLKMKLSMISPDKPHPKQRPYPSIHRPKGHEFAWLKRRRELMDRRLEQYKDLPK